MKTQTVIVLIVAIILIVVGGAIAYTLLVPGTSSTPSRTPSGPAVCSASGGGASPGNWTTYHQNNIRSGVEPSSNITAVSARWSGSVTLDADVYAEPLVCGNTVYVATEDDTVYAVNSTSGAIVWQQHLGTPVESSTLPCGDIGPTTGITGTPVIDVSTGVLYAVAFLAPDQHVLFGLDVDNGTVVSQVDVDPAGANPMVEQQRGALALASGYVYVVYGGLDGDCGDYHGWVVGVPTSGSGGLVAYQVPTHREGGIWGTAGMGLAANGTLYVATGNGDSSTTFDHGDAVIALSPTLTELGYFAPTNWKQLNEQDTD
ncbi:MAG TPA: PQQ-binding-like beta-propeller repeat protein, partial [Acidimicrobiales bacterium]|nr:PQQ-binding-like beta-propeller repeat protein [Acidimicrobiales bacterium]